MADDQITEDLMEPGYLLLDARAEVAEREWRRRFNALDGRLRVLEAQHGITDVTLDGD